MAHSSTFLLCFLRATSSVSMWSAALEFVPGDRYTNSFTVTNKGHRFRRFCSSQHLLSCYRAPIAKPVPRILHLFNISTPFLLPLLMVVWVRAKLRKCPQNYSGPKDRSLFLSNIFSRYFSLIFIRASVLEKSVLSPLLSHKILHFRPFWLPNVWRFSPNKQFSGTPAGCPVI